MQELFYQIILADYKVYVWLDADMWINDLSSFHLYEKGALNNKLTIVPQSDRAYVKNANVEWFFGFPKKIKLLTIKILVDLFQKR